MALPTLAVLDKDGNPQTINTLPGGRQADANSVSVAVSTEDAAILGALTETAPATDTASSGLNGRLQRIAQRITSLIALLPSALGQNARANSLSVTVATDDAVIGAVGASPAANTLMDRLKTLATLLTGGMVASLGSLGDAASPSVAFSTEGKAQLGALTEAAPASDTASAGLNGRLQRIAQRLTSIIALLPAALGRNADAASLSVALSTEDAALVGALTETAPASDTASSGLNGRLQRIAQRLTSMIALLPTALGRNADTASLSVAISTEDAALLGALTETAPATDTASSGLNGRAQRIAQRLTSLIALIPSALGQNAKANSLSVTVATDDAVLGAAGATPAQYTLLDRLRQMNRFFGAVATTLTRPANQTAYTATDSISNNATPGSVTALSATVSSFNDAPLLLDWIKVDTNDTGLAGKSIRCHVFQSDPTANTGVVGGDNLTWSNKRAGYLGSFSGSFRTFSDGGVARLVPDEGAPMVIFPTSGAATLFIQYQALSDFTPSANSTTLIATLFGRQGQA